MMYTRSVMSTASFARILLAVCVCLRITSAIPGYQEHLLLRPLPAPSLLGSFNFRTQTPASSFKSQNFPLFPRSLGQIVQHAHAKELHLRFSSGRWDSEKWGAMPNNGRQEGGTGVELWAWVEADSEEQAEERWFSLVNALSGLFCASLNFIDSTRTLRPVMTFQPQGHHTNASLSTLHLLHGTLPGEVVCTENLTPFLKLLPCKEKAGISSLLDGHKIFDSTWQSMAIDVQPVCPKGATECVVELHQTVDMVVSIERAKRRRDDPIPRPLRIEDISCDTSKPYSEYGDSCYPLAGPYSPSFSLSEIFGKAINGACPYRDETLVNPEPLCLDMPLEREKSIDTQGAYGERLRDGNTCLTLPVGTPFDLKVEETNIVTPLSIEASIVRAERTLTGYGQQHGGLRTVFTNLLPSEEITISYFEPMPWFMRVFLHTLRAEITTPSGSRHAVDRQDLIRNAIYRPAVDRVRASHLEIVLTIPAGSTLTLTYDVEKTILRYSEYPPDANRGFNVPSAIVRILSPRFNEPRYVRTTSLLLYLPTPDFSMPYNVIILTSTVIALAFGTIFNLLVRRFVAKDEGPAGGRVKNMIKGQIVRLRALLTAKKKKEE